MINEKKIKQLLKEKKIVIQEFDFNSDLDNDAMSEKMITRLAKTIKRRQHFKLPDNIDDYDVSIQVVADNSCIYLSGIKGLNSILIQKRCPSKYDGMGADDSWEKDVFEMLNWNLPEDKIKDIFECLHSQKNWRGKKDSYSIFEAATLWYLAKSKHFELSGMIGFDDGTCFNGLEELHNELMTSRNQLNDEI